MEQALPNDLILEVIHKFIEFGPSFDEWLPLRLVSRFFNQEILLALFVFRKGQSLHDYDRMTEDEPYFSQIRQPFLSSDAFQKRNPKHHYRYQRFQRLLTSWWLQGLILRSVHHHHNNDDENSLWINAIGNATKCLEGWIRLPSHDTFKASLVSMQRSTLGATRGSFVLPMVAEVACDALVCLFGPQDVSKEVFNPPTKPKVEPWSSEFPLLIICAFVGDVRAIAHVVGSLNPENVKKEVFILFYGLIVAARQGHSDAVQYLLETDIGRPNWGYACSSTIVPAVESGNLEMVDIFLGPRYGIYLSGSQLERAIIVAAESPDPTMRREIVKRLLNTSVHDKLRLRHLVLATACKINDFALAKLTVDGWSPLTMAYENFGLMHPLESACRFRRPEILALLFRATNKNRGEKYQAAVEHWLDWSIQQAYDDIYMEFLPHLTWLSPQDPRIMLHAASVEDALPKLSNY